MALVGNKVFADDQVKMRSLGWVLTPWDWGPIGRGQDADTHRGAARADTGRRRPSARPGERPQEDQPRPHLGMGLQPPTEK